MWCNDFGRDWIFAWRIAGRRRLQFEWNRGNDGEDRHVTPLPNVEDSNDGALGKCDGEKEHLIMGGANKTTPWEAKDIGTGGEGADGSGYLCQKILRCFCQGTHSIAAHLRLDEDGVLVITMKGRTGQFKLIEGDDAIDDDPLTFHFHVCVVTNQEKIPKREEPPVTFVSLIYFYSSSYWSFFHLFSVKKGSTVCRRTPTHTDTTNSRSYVTLVIWPVFRLTGLVIYSVSPPAYRYALNKNIFRKTLVTSHSLHYPQTPCTTNLASFFIDADISPGHPPVSGISGLKMNWEW